MRSEHRIYPLDVEVSMDRDVDFARVGGQEVSRPGPLSARVTIKYWNPEEPNTVYVSTFKMESVLGQREERLEVAGELEQELGERLKQAYDDYTDKGGRL